MWEIH